MALMISACSSNDIEQTAPQLNTKAEGIPFTATISIGESATTRALTESGSNIVPSWATGEKVALIHNDVIDEMEVQSVSNGLATLTGTLTGSPANDDHVTIIYPSSAADGTTGNVKADLLAAQDGTLATIAEKYDVRKGAGTLNVGATATLYGNVSLTNQFAIFKFTIKNADASANINLKAGEPFIITSGTQCFFITPTSATNVLYVALPAINNSFRVRFYAIGDDSKAYVYSKPSITFAAGNYYQSTLKMKTTVLPGQFYVGSGTVQFSRGNLQAIYDGSEWTWVIATEQWDKIGDTSANSNINGDGTISGTGTVDLFGWVGASSTWTGAAQYGISKSYDTNNTDGYGNVADEALKSDWGNTIGGGWRTLTKDEWSYLFSTSRSGSTVLGSQSIYTFANIAGAGDGIILFPDGGSFDNTEASWGTINGLGANKTICTADQWTALEAKGCVFLVLTNYRNGTEVQGASHGRYWTSTPVDASKAYELYFSSSTPEFRNTTDRYYGLSVRLVRAAQ